MLGSGRSVSREHQASSEGTAVLLVVAASSTRATDAASHLTLAHIVHDMVVQSGCHGRVEVHRRVAAGQLSLTSAARASLRATEHLHATLYVLELRLALVRSRSVSAVFVRRVCAARLARVVVALLCGAASSASSCRPRRGASLALSAGASRSRCATYQLLLLVRIEMDRWLMNLTHKARASNAALGCLLLRLESSRCLLRLVSVHLHLLIAVEVAAETAQILLTLVTRLLIHAALAGLSAGAKHGRLYCHERLLLVLAAGRLLFFFHDVRQAILHLLMLLVAVLRHGHVGLSRERILLRATEALIDRHRVVAGAQYLTVVQVASGATALVTVRHGRAEAATASWHVAVRLTLA